MPKWTNPQVLQDASFEFVKNAFRGWRPEPLQVNDIGLDMRFEIIESDGKATGAEFSTQIKATERIKFSGDSVVHNCDVRTVNYFLSRPELVLFIVYDARRNIAYWIWVQEYIRINWKPLWLQNETITIKVPKDNILTKEAKDTIARRVRWHHEQQKLITAAQTANDPYYRYEVVTSDSESKISVYPKYPEAVRDSPITVSGVFKFDRKTQEGEEAYAKYEKFIKFGDELKLDNKHFEGFSFPKAFSNLIAPFTDFHPKSIAIRLLPDNTVLPVKYTFTSNDGKYICEIPYIELRIKKSGTQQIELSNDRQQSPYRVTTIIRYGQSGLVNIHSSSSVKSMGEALNNLLFQRVAAVGGKFKTTFLSSGVIQEDKLEPINISAPEDWVIQLAQDMVFIEKITNIALHWPDKISQHDGVVARTVVKILKTGKSTMSGAKLGVPVNGAFLRHLSAIIPADQPTFYRITTKTEVVDLCGQEIDLGPMQSLIPTATFSEAASQISVDAMPDDDQVTLMLDLPSDLIQYFPKWLSQLEPVAGFVSSSS